jgi:hypothetical protein
MRRARTCRWLRMRPYRVLLSGQGVFFAAQSSGDCITSMAGFDLRQAQGSSPEFSAVPPRPVHSDIEARANRHRWAVARPTPVRPVARPDAAVGRRLYIRTRDRDDVVPRRSCFRGLLAKRARVSPLVAEVWTGAYPDYLIACGLIGDPAAPGRCSGGATKKNS